jgi:hypothetical protein
MELHRFRPACWTRWPPATASASSPTSAVPLAALAGILLFVAWNRGEWREFARLKNFSLPYRTVLVGTFLATVIFDLTVAVEGGLVPACVFFIHSMSTLFRIERLELVPTLDATFETGRRLIVRGRCASGARTCGSTRPSSPSCLHGRVARAAGFHAQAPMDLAGGAGGLVGDELGAHQEEKVAPHRPGPDTGGHQQAGHHQQPLAAGCENASSAPSAASVHSSNSTRCEWLRSSSRSYHFAKPRCRIVSGIAMADAPAAAMVAPGDRPCSARQPTARGGQPGHRGEGAGAALRAGQRPQPLQQLGRGPGVGMPPGGAPRP